MAAAGFVKKGQKLRVQACRFRGSASSADLSVGFVAIAERGQGKVQIVNVNTGSRKDMRRLQSLGLDLTEHGDGRLRRGRDAVLADPPPGTYTAVIVNYDQIDGQPYDDWGNGRVEFDHPRPRVETGVQEAWTLTCTRPDGQSGTPQEVFVGGASVPASATPAQRPRPRASARQHL